MSGCSVQGVPFSDSKVREVNKRWIERQLLREQAAQKRLAKLEVGRKKDLIWGTVVLYIASLVQGLHEGAVSQSLLE